MLRTSAAGGRSPRKGFRVAIVYSSSALLIPRHGQLWNGAPERFLKTPKFSETLRSGAGSKARPGMNESALNANVGYRVRSLRLSRNIKQADAARELGVSAAYLNLIEKGKRVMPFPLLWKALRYFEQDPEQFMSSLGEGRADEALAKLLDEPLLKSLDIDPESIQHLSAEPKLAGTVAALFNLYKNTRTQLENVLAQLSVEERARARGTLAGEMPGLRFDYSPFDEVTDFLEAHRN